MNIFCLEDFKVEFDKLISIKSYKTLEKEIIDYFFDKPFLDLCSGTRLNNSKDAPYIKKRISGSGGYRFYFLLIINKENLYLMFVHPKSGSKGAGNITDESKAFLYKEILKCIKSNKLYRLTLNNSKKNLVFRKL